MAAAAKNNNNKEVLQERNCTSENFYYLPRRFKNLAKPLLAAFQTCHPGTSAEVLNCFYTACTGWSFILPAERQSSTKLLSSFSSPLRLPYSYSTFFSLYSYFPPFSYFPSLLYAYVYLGLKMSISLSPLLPLWLLYYPKFSCSQFTSFPFLSSKYYLCNFSIPSTNFSILKNFFNPSL